ncbi:MAG: CHASE3 domain-containing protein, partial [Acidobacteriaceae bacterium]
MRALVALDCRRAALGDPLETAAYRKLLVRLLALPIIALALLAFILVYGFRQVERGARRVDRADQVIAHANNLIKLMVDEETGLRGFMITHDPAFLQPYQEATKELGPEFARLYDLVKRDPEQTARLQSMQTASRLWQQSAGSALAAPALAPELALQMRQRKQQMDAVRAAADDFLSAETSLRASRSFASLRVDSLTLYGLVGLAIVLGSLLAWEIARVFRKLGETYNQQLKEVQRWGDESYSREQWLNTTLRSIGDAVIACNPQGNVVFMNGVAEQLTGWNEADADKLPLSDIFVIRNQRTRAVVENPVELVLRSGTVVGLANHTILIRKDQSELS